MNLSVFTICQDEERIIDKSLSQAKKLINKLEPNSEIVIVDSGSKDKTVEIAKRHTNKVYHKDWLGYSGQKNYALSLCNNKWVLSLDADEVLTDELVEEIVDTLSLINKKEGALKKIDALAIPRKLYIGDKPVKRGGYYPDYQLMLFRKDTGCFSDVKVHESVELKDPITGLYKNKKNKESKKRILNLSNHLDHYSHDSLDSLKDTLKKYAQLFNEDLPDRKKKGLCIASLKALYTFVNKLLIKRGVLDGPLGVKLALLQAQYTYNKYRK